MINVKKIAAGAAAAVLLSAAPSLAATMLFDDFDGPTQRAVDAPYPGVDNTSSVAFGSGQRILSAENAANNGIPEAATSLAVTDGTLSFSNNDKATGSGTLTYTNVGNIVLGPDPFFLFEVGFFDRAAEFFASVTDTMGRTSTYFEPLEAGFDPKLRFAQFGGDADFSIVDTLSFTISTIGGFEAVDGSLDSISISAVPLPAGGLLLICGLGGLAAMRRKKSL